MDEVKSMRLGLFFELGPTNVPVLMLVGLSKMKLPDV